MKQPVNKNYAATVIEIKNITTLEGSDNLVGVPMFGMQAITDKNKQEGDIMLLFPAETQLSEQFTKGNNLYRAETLNEDETKKGYIENNRRVKAIKLRGHRSDALLLPLTSLLAVGATTAEIDALKVGDMFDEWNGVPVCNKYMVKRAAVHDKTQKNAVKAHRVNPALFPQHVDTDNFWRNEHLLKSSDTIILTQKLHGTSFRVANLPTLRKLSLFERTLLWLRLAELV